MTDYHTDKSLLFVVTRMRDYSRNGFQKFVAPSHQRPLTFSSFLCDPLIPDLQVGKHSTGKKERAKQTPALFQHSSLFGNVCDRTAASRKWANQDMADVPQSRKWAKMRNFESGEKERLL